MYSQNESLSSKFYIFGQILSSKMKMFNSPKFRGDYHPFPLRRHKCPHSSPPPVNSSGSATK